MEVTEHFRQGGANAFPEGSIDRIEVKVQDDGLTVAVEVEGNRNFRRFINHDKQSVERMVIES